MTKEEIEIFDEIEDKNYQSCYWSVRRRLQTGLQLLSFLEETLTSTYISNHKELLIEALKKKPINKYSFENLLRNEMIDTVCISIVIENFIKAALISNGVIIHKLDKPLRDKLNINQSKRPVLIDELLKTEKWEENNDIDLPIKYRVQIKGITSYTLGLNDILKEKYLRIFNFNENHIDIIRKIKKRRDELHYYRERVSTISINSISEYISLESFLIKNIRLFQKNIENEMSKLTN